MICTREGWTFRTSNPTIIEKALNALEQFKIEDALAATSLLGNLSRKKFDVLSGIRKFYTGKNDPGAAGRQRK